MRVPKLFFREFNDSWYVHLGKRQIPHAKGKANEKEASLRDYEVMAEHGQRVSNSSKGEDFGEEVRVHQAAEHLAAQAVVEGMALQESDSEAL